MEIVEISEMLKYGPYLSKRECIDYSSIVNDEVGLVTDPIKTQVQIENLKKIEQFLRDEFGLKDKDISKPMHPDVYNGTIFRIISEEKELICEMRIVLLKSMSANVSPTNVSSTNVSDTIIDLSIPIEHKVMYACKVSIDYPANWSIHQYKDLCSEIKNGIKALKMKRFVKNGEKCTDPMIYEIYEDIDLESFKTFVQEIQVLSSDFTLKYPIGMLLW